MSVMNLIKACRGQIMAEGSAINTLIYIKSYNANLRVSHADS